MTRLSISRLLGAAAALWVLAAWPILGAQSATAGELFGRATVIDGDTIDIRGERMRLHGIDAPESGQWCLDASRERYRCGQRSAFALADKIGAANVRCELLERDRYGRHIARCFRADADLNEWMVLQGHAVAYRQYSSDYVDAEASARAKSIGVWQGDFDLPWVWRQARRSTSSGQSTPARAALQTSCVIKGNISPNGRIYHLPGQQHYVRTKIDVGKGERWFCSEGEARAAGWRRALQ
jgi:endonuclease YncB( thermonuclease family)